MIGGRVENKEIGLIPPADCIAKTTRDQPGISVEKHCQIVGLVARELISLFPENIRNDLFPEGTDFIAACHDIGKLSPAFQKMIYKSLPEYAGKYEDVFSMVNVENAGRRTAGFHAAVSQLSIDGSGKYVPEILGIHHGFSPSTNNMQKGCFLHGGAVWQLARESLVNRLRAFYSCPAGFWPAFSQAQAGVVSGLVTVADWIGSGDFFSDCIFNTVFSSSELESRVSAAVRTAGFRRIQVIKGLSFQEIFPFTPNMIQNRLVSIVDRPGVYILEAPMGIGKTEAAFFAAYTLLAKESATGIYFALPTQLTSEKIYERMGLFLDRILDPASGVERARLLHGAAWLKEATMGENADTGGSWFDGTKRGILAPFAAGTIDQALMAVMNVRHGFVRTFGLAGKVVILDEVHSYDSYTGTILNRLVEELRKIHCTVIILSATLTERQRRVLLEFDGLKALSSGYPLVSAISDPPGMEPYEAACSAEQRIESEVNCTSEMDAVIEDVLDRAFNGEQVLWIENTIAEAQEVFKRLSANCSGSNVECGLLHSRFLKRDREEIENRWVSLYGKTGVSRRKENGRILVGTQVLEQSIDIDADYLVTRLCPSDMILQRIGRLWRHRENDSVRPESTRCKATILAPSFSDAVEKPGQFGKSGAVYSEYVLIRTLEVWNDRKRITIPGDIRDLIESTYSDRVESGLSARYQREMRDKKDTLQRLARVGLSRGIETLPESKASTRYSELDTVEVLLLKRFRYTDTEFELFFLDGSSTVAPVSCTDRATRRAVASSIMRQTVRVADYLAPEAGGPLHVLAQYVYVGSKDEGEQPFRVAIVGQDDEIAGLDGSRANAETVLHYDCVSGYQCEKR